MVTVITGTAILVAIASIIMTISSRSVAKLTARTITTNIGYATTICAIVRVKVSNSGMIVTTRAIKLHTVVAANTIAMQIYIDIVIVIIAIIMISIK